MRNGSLAALRLPAHGGFRNSSGVALAVHGRSEFDTDADVDIATMAAQRDQLRGARNVRGMMAPVMSKEVRGKVLFPLFVGIGCQPRLSKCDKRLHSALKRKTQQ